MGRRQATRGIVAALATGSLLVGLGAVTAAAGAANSTWSNANSSSAFDHGGNGTPATGTTPPTTPAIPVNPLVGAPTTGSTAHPSITGVLPIAAAGEGVPGYRNPMRAVAGLNAERIDQGVDYSGTGPVYALGPGTVTYVNSTGQWFPPAPWYVAYKLSQGPARGFTVYVAECVHPRVTVGQTVTTNTVVGKMFSCGYGIETGWANGHRLPNTKAAACWNAYNDGSDPSGYGINFSDLLQRLGAPPGQIDGTPICPVPANSGLPTW